MAKFNGRIHRIMLKTHYFVSAYELKLIEDFYKAQLDDGGVSLDDFRKECAELSRLVKKHEDDTEKISELFKEAYGKNPLIYYAFMYSIVKDDFQKFPYGLFVSNLNIEVKALLKHAREFLGERKNDIKT